MEVTYNDYLGNEIHVGDIVLFNEKGSKGYRSSFSEGEVEELGKPNKYCVKIKGIRYSKKCFCVVNLSAIGLR